jgi:membrane protein
MKLLNYLRALLWDSPPHESFLLRGLQHILRIIYVVIRDLADGQLTLRAMSLVYTTLLSLVPLLALGFSVLKGFGVHNKVEPMLLNLLAPLGAQGVEISNRIIEFVNNVKVGVLGSLGLLLLLYTVISLLQKIERAFNYTWKVSQSRSFIHRFSDYLSVVFVGPMFIVLALGITASISDSSVVVWMHDYVILDFIVNYTGKAVPYMLIIAAFTFIYMLMPNTKVKLKSALVGAVIAGIIWETTGWVFASFLLNSPNYIAIYSAFATLMFFLIWLYLNWVILLLGASIAFYHQNPEYLTPNQVSLKISSSAKELLTMQVLLLICRRYNAMENEISFEEITEITSTPSIILSETLDSLEKGGFIIHTSENTTRYFPAKPLNKIKVIDVIHHVRNDGINYLLESNIKPIRAEISGMFIAVEKAIELSLNDMTILELLENSEAEAV